MQLRMLGGLVAMVTALFGQGRVGANVQWPLVADESTTSNFAHNAAGNWSAAGIIAGANKTLSSINVCIASITGTPVANDLRVELFSDSAGKPNTSLEGVTVASAPAVGCFTASGFTTSVTAGSLYWAVFKNLNGTPASNYFTISRRSATVNLFGQNSASVATQNEWMGASTTDSGTVWTRSGALLPATFVWSDGTFSGFPIQTGNSTTCQVYSARECGLHFKTGALGIKVTGVAGMVSKTGTPTGSVRYRLYEGVANSRTLIATTGVANTAAITTTLGYTGLWFSSTLLLKPDTWYTLAMSETTQGDASTNRFNTTTYNLVSTYASLFATSGMGATPKYSLSTDGGATWSDTSDMYASLSFIQDHVRPVVVPARGFLQSF